MRVSRKGRLIVYQLALCFFFTIFMSGCLLTKIVTVPMRVAGAVVSIIPVAGNTAHEVIDEAAETVDELPF
ncbi:MAG TPA: hypothetical protein ENO11_05015 [Desulfobacteraceae bacterium]|nr:hypothetical protein [Desulfobacteraceae bacterium]